MASLLNANGLMVRFGADPLFSGLNVNIAEGERLGLIGPNGAGKSTLLEVLAGERAPDAGTVALRKNTRLGYIAQISEFASGVTVREVLVRACERAGVPEAERGGRIAETLGRAGFTDAEQLAAALSGGWRKRLAVAEALVREPDLLLLDEPTNHLDMAGIEWLEALLLQAAFAVVVVSHDRYFLDNVGSSTAELSRVYPEGILRVDGGYSRFLERKSEFLAAQAKHQEALGNRVRNEIEWLRRGPKARATKAKARIDKAQQLIGELNDLNARTQTARTEIDFTATQRKTKRLIETRGATAVVGERTILSGLNLVLTAGSRAGLVGPNGSGKTTLLRLLRGELAPQSGEVLRADGLRVVYFDQNRALDPDLTLRRALAPHGDSVIYREQTIHVAGWAARFLFENEQLNQPVSRLSGGERARVLLAKLMLEPADVLLLDESTNDLDIPTLEVLEESLLEFGGAMVLVTHDRFLLDRVSTVVWGLDGSGGAGTFADYSQWEDWLAEQRDKARSTKTTQAKRDEAPPEAVAPPAAKKKLSYLDSRDYESIEARIGEAESDLAAKQKLLEDPAVTADSTRLQAALSDIENAQEGIDKLYARWAELEAKTG